MVAHINLPSEGQHAETVNGHAGEHPPASDPASAGGVAVGSHPAIIRANGRSDAAKEAFVITR